MFNQHQFLIIAALVAVAAAEYAAYKPAYKGNLIQINNLVLLHFCWWHFYKCINLIWIFLAEYAAPAYSAPAYKAPAYETYAPLPYSFAYDVNDEYYNNMGHKETRYLN